MTMYALFLYTECYDDACYHDVIGIFSSRDKAEKAIKDFKELNVIDDEDDYVVDWNLKIKPVKTDMLLEDSWKWIINL